MRFILPIVCLAIASPVLAQAPTAPPTSPSAPVTTAAVTTISPLPIPVPSNTKIQLEVDAQDEDMLGLVKDFLAGVTAQNIVDSMAAADEEDDTDSAAAKATSLTTKAGKHKAKKRKPAILPSDLGKLSLADVLHNIDHVHLLVLEIPTPPAPSKSTHVKPAIAVPSGLAPLTTGEIAATPVAPSVTEKTLANFYETSFHQEGAHRIVWADYEDVKVLMVGFHEKRGSAMVFQIPGNIIILRSDGNLDLKPLNALFSTAIHEAAKSLPL